MPALRNLRRMVGWASLAWAWILPLRLALAEDAATANLPPPATRLVTGLNGALTNMEFILALAVLVFGLLALLLQAVVFWGRFARGETVRLMAATLVVTATLFLIAAGFSNDQIAPAIGLFGTMLGYLLGRETGPQRQREHRDGEGG